MIYKLQNRFEGKFNHKYARLDSKSGSFVNKFSSPCSTHCSQEQFAFIDNRTQLTFIVCSLLSIRFELSTRVYAHSFS